MEERGVVASDPHCSVRPERSKETSWLLEEVEEEEEEEDMTKRQGGG